jgi:hypothetical protein
MSGALITVRCGCGQTTYLSYGEKWECPECGERWNTNQIPADEYWGIMREQRRYRLVAMGVAFAIAVAGIALSVLMGRQFLVPACLIMAFWFLLFMPYWRRRVRSRARNLPTWDLRSE